MNWGKQDSNLRRLTPPDLQSGPFGHSGIPPLHDFFRPAILSGNLPNKHQFREKNQANSFAEASGGT